MVKITSSVAGKWLDDVPVGEQFWCQDGRVLKNLWELQAALSDMREETFRHHSNETKNDFSNWVKDVIGDEKLSRDLLRSTTKAQAARSVASRIAWLEDKMAAK